MRLKRIIVSILVTSSLLILSCQSDKTLAMKPLPLDQTESILVAAVSFPKQEDCQPLVYERSLRGLGASTIDFLVGQSDFSELRQILEELDRLNPEPKRLTFNLSEIRVLTEEEHETVVSSEDYLSEIVRLAPDACQITSVSYPLIFEKGQEAAVYIARARGPLAGELYLLLLEHRSSGWNPVRAILIARS